LIELAKNAGSKRARRFLAGLPEGGLRAAIVEDVRDALCSMSAGISEASARQYVLRVKSLLGYAHALGYTPFNAGATIKVRSNANRGATLAKRIISEVEVGLLIRAAPSKRDRVLLEVIYAGGLRVSETVALTWADVLPRDDRVQLSILGKGGKVRQVLLPEIVSRALLSLRGEAGNNDAVFRSRMGGGKPTERNVNAMVKRAAAKAGINEAVSPHWLRYAHGSHAIDRGASLPEVQTTLGHGNIATTSGCSGGRHPGRRAWQHATSDPRLDGGPAWASDWAQGLM
jgi:site-specific recombinase XerD